MANFNQGLGIVLSATDKGLGKAVDRVGKGLKGIGDQLRNLEDEAKADRVAEMFRNWGAGLVRNVDYGIERVKSGLFGAIADGKDLYKEFEHGTALVSAEAALSQKQWARLRSSVSDVSVATGESTDKVTELFKTMLEHGRGFDDTAASIVRKAKIMRTFGLSPQALGSFEEAQRLVGMSDQGMEDLLGAGLAVSKAFGNIPISIDTLPKTLIEVKNKLAFMPLVQKDAVKASKSVLALGAAFTKGLGMSASDAQQEAVNMFGKFAEATGGIQEAFAGLQDQFPEFAGGIAVAFRSVKSSMDAVQTGTMDPAQFSGDMMKTIGEARKSMGANSAAFQHFRTWVNQSFGPKATQLWFDNAEKVQGIFAEDLPKALGQAGNAFRDQVNRNDGLAVTRQDRMRQRVDRMKRQLGEAFVGLEAKFLPLVLSGMKLLERVVGTMTKKGGPLDRLGSFISQIFPAEGGIDQKAANKAFSALKDAANEAMKAITGLDWAGFSRKIIDGMLAGAKAAISSLSGGQLAGLGAGALLFGPSGLRAFVGTGLAGAGKLLAKGVSGVMGGLGSWMSAAGGAAEGAGGLLGAGGGRRAAAAAGSSAVELFGSFKDGSRALGDWLMKQKDVNLAVNATRAAFDRTKMGLQLWGSALSDKFGVAVSKAGEVAGQFGGRVWGVAQGPLASAGAAIGSWAGKVASFVSPVTDKLAAGFQTVSGTLLGKVGLVGAAALAGWEIGKFIGDLKVGGKSINDWTVSLYEWVGDLFSKLGRLWNKLLNKVGLGKSAQERLGLTDRRADQLAEKLGAARNGDAGALDFLRGQISNGAEAEDAAEVIAQRLGEDEAGLLGWLQSHSVGAKSAPSGGAPRIPGAAPAPAPAAPALDPGILTAMGGPALDVTALAKALKDVLGDLVNRPVLVQIDGRTVARAVAGHQQREAAAALGS